MKKKILFAALMFVALFLGFGCDNDEPEPIEEIKYYDVEIENAKVIVNSTDTFHSRFGNTFKDKLKSGTKITVMPVSLQNHEELQFKGWSDTEIKDSIRTIIVSSDTTIACLFKGAYKVNIKANFLNINVDNALFNEWYCEDTNKKRFGVDRYVITNSDKKYYKEGEQITISIKPNTDCEFKGWSDTEEMNTTRTITVNSDTSIIVNLFLFYRMRVDINNPQYGTVIPNCGEYQIGDTVRLEAIPNDSGVFMGWRDAHGNAVFSSTLVYPVNPEVFTAIRPQNKTEYVRYNYSTYTYIVSVSFKQGENGYCYVDLGLPSGLKWGVAPVGDSFFRWEKYYLSYGSQLRGYYDEDFRYSYCYNSDEYFDATCGDDDDIDCFTKYNDEDGKTVLDLEDDWAYVERGGKWRTPTVEEWEELIENCIVEYPEEFSSKDELSLISKINGKKIVIYPYITRGGMLCDIPNNVDFRTSSFASKDKTGMYIVWFKYYGKTLWLETTLGYRHGLGFILPVLDK